MQIKRIGLEHVEIIAHQLAVATMQWDEPIPPFRTRFPRVLESCINAPFQTYNGRDLYPTFEKKAAILFYLLVKNHPFQNLPAPQANEFCVYLLRCADNSIYIGQTSNLEKRIKEHQQGLNSWTKSRLPIELVHTEIFKTREETVTRERRLKTGYGRIWIKRSLQKFASRQAGGNKRIAVTTLLVFLFLNNRWLEVQPTKLYNLALWVAQSDPDLRDAVLAGLNDFLTKYTQTLKN